MQGLNWGKNKYDLAGVNWELAVDYSVWEAPWSDNLAKAKRLQKRAVKKCRGIFWHYSVYDPSGS
jgi:hypothetical protein